MFINQRFSVALFNKITYLTNIAGHINYIIVNKYSFYQIHHLLQNKTTVSWKQNEKTIFNYKPYILQTATKLELVEGNQSDIHLLHFSVPFHIRKAKEENIGNYSCLVKVEEMKEKLMLYHTFYPKSKALTTKTHHAYSEGKHVTFDCLFMVKTC